MPTPRLIVEWAENPSKGFWTVTVFCSLFREDGQYFGFSDMLKSLQGQPAQLGRFTALQPFDRGRESKLAGYAQKTVVRGRHLFQFAGKFIDIKIFLDRLKISGALKSEDFLEDAVKEAANGLSSSILYVHRGPTRISYLNFDCDIIVEDEYSMVGEGTGFEDIHHAIPAHEANGPDAPEGRAIQLLGSLIYGEMYSRKHPDKAYGAGYELIAANERGFLKIPYRLNMFLVQENGSLALSKILNLIYKKNHAVLGVVDALPGYDTDSGRPHVGMSYYPAFDLLKPAKKIKVGNKEMWETRSHMFLQLIFSSNGFAIHKKTSDLLPVELDASGHPGITVTEQFQSWRRGVEESFRRGPPDGI
jgi:hypothetical protein